VEARNASLRDFSVRKTIPNRLDEFGKLLKLGLMCWVGRWEWPLGMTLFPTFIFNLRVSGIFVEAYMWLNSVRFLHRTVILKFSFGNGGSYFVQNSFWCLNPIFFFRTISSQHQVFTYNITKFKCWEQYVFSHYTVIGTGGSIIMPSLPLNMWVAVAIHRSTVMVQGMWIQLQWSVMKEILEFLGFCEILLICL
jgi:hypothetical protein